MKKEDVRLRTMFKHSFGQFPCIKIARELKGKSIVVSKCSTSRKLLIEHLVGKCSEKLFGKESEYRDTSERGVYHRNICTAGFSTAKMKVIVLQYHRPRQVKGCRLNPRSKRLPISFIPWF